MKTCKRGLHEYEGRYCKECQYLKSLEWQSNNRDRYKAWQLKTKFWPELSVDEALSKYNELAECQNNVCAICKQPETGKTSRKDGVKVLSVDHDHDTNKVRGLLCQRCNHAVGLFQDNPEICEAAASYLKKNSL